MHHLPKCSIGTGRARQSLWRAAEKVVDAGHTFRTYPDALRLMYESADQSFNEWNHAKGEFAPFETTDLAKRVRAMAGEIGDEVRYLIDEISPFRAHKVSWIASYERTRNAKYRALTPDDIDRMRPSYEKHVFTEADLDLMGNETDFEFGMMAKGGKFVRGFDEPDESGMTIAEEMRRDLAGHAPEGHATYQGRCLEDARTGEILAWLTYWQTPENPSPEYVKGVIHPYIEKGITNGKVQYWGGRDLAFLKKYADKSMLFDTITASMPGATSRLLAHAFHDMERANPALKQILLYRLDYLSLVPALRERENEWHAFAKNFGSDTLFLNRGFHHYMSDWNESPDESAPHVKRMICGKQRLVFPQWEHNIGELGLVTQMSDHSWAGSRICVGNNTDDGLPYIKQPHKPKGAIWPKNW